MDIYLNEKNNGLNNNYICPFCNSKKINPLNNLTNIINHKNFVLLINTLSSHIVNFYNNFKKIINDITNINTSLGNQTNRSKFLVKGIVIKNINYVERYRQLCDRIDMINESKKILDDNFSLINKNLNIFITDIKQIFKKIKNLRIQKANEVFNQNNINNIYEQNINYNNNKIFSENNILDVNNYDENNRDYIFNSININDEDQQKRRVFSYTHTPKNMLNSYIDKDIYNNNNIEYLVNNIKPKQIENKNTNTLIIPNNINQNIFNYTITSRELNNLNNNRNINNFNKLNNNKSFNNTKIQKQRREQLFSRNNNELNNNKNINIKKINRSSSIPDMLNKNKKNMSLSNQQKNVKNETNNSMPKNYNSIKINNYFRNKNDNINNNINNNMNNMNNIILKLCYEVKEIIKILDKKDLDKYIISDEKKKELNILINNIIKNNNLYKVKINKSKEKNNNIIHNYGIITNK